MGDKDKSAGEKLQPDGPLSKGRSDLMRLPKKVRPLPGLRTHASPLHAPFGLQYQGSSPRKHIKGNGAGITSVISRRGTVDILGTVGGRVSKLVGAPPRSTTLASANTAASLRSQTNNNKSNNKHNTIVRITRTAPSPEPMMESFHFLNDHTPCAEPEEQGLPSFQSFVSRNSPSPAQWHPDIGINTNRSMVVPDPLSRYDFGILQNQVHLLRSNNELQEQEMNRFRNYIAELAGFNENIHKYLGSLHSRLHVLEVENARYREGFKDLDDYVYSRSPHLGAGATYRNNDVSHTRPSSQDPEESFVYMAPGDQDVFEGAEEHYAEEQVMQTTANGLPTPTYTNGPPTATSFSFNRPPRIASSQPKITTLTGARKPTTMLAKRSVHNLSKTMAPATTQLPQMPLTNVEVIAYFFNSLSRPMVALRLYAQNEGPASITGILNQHRNTKPPYLRNTCSVKCVTAIRRGKELYGPEWEGKYRALFEDAMEMEDKDTGLMKATELIRIPDEESEDATDIDVLELLNGLSQHPKENEGRGSFTACVEYCEANRLHWPLSEIHVLAAELHAGRRPQAYGGNSDDGMEVGTKPNDVRSRIKRDTSDLSEMVADMGSDFIIGMSDTDADTIIDNGLYADYNPGGKENGEPDELHNHDSVEDVGVE